MKSLFSKFTILCVGCTLCVCTHAKGPDKEQDYRPQLKKCLLKLASRERKVWERRKGDNYETKHERKLRIKKHAKKAKKSALGPKTVDLFDENDLR